MTYPHEYPPKKALTKSNVPTKRFKLLSALSRSKKNKNEQTSEKNDIPKDMDNKEANNSEQGPISWPEHWEQGDYPFVALEGNRAACAICLMDFEEPQRKDRNAVNVSEDSQISVSQPEEKADNDKKNKTQDTVGVSTPPPNSTETQTRNNPLPTLTDAGDGAQPLRLLACSHVFHVGPLCLQAIE